MVAMYSSIGLYAGYTNVFVIGLGTIVLLSYNNIMKNVFSKY